MAIAAAGGAAGNTGAGGSLSEARRLLGADAGATGAMGRDVVAGRDWITAATGAGRIASAGAAAGGEGGGAITGIDATGLVDGAGAAVVGCTTGPGAAIFARSTTGKGAGTDAIRLRPPLSVTAEDIALLLEKLGRLFAAV